MEKFHIWRELFVLCWENWCDAYLGESYQLCFLPTGLYQKLTVWH